MLQIDRHQIENRPDAPPPRIRILCVGNAGVNLADRLTIGSVGPAEIIAVNTDSMSLNTTIAARKLLIGSRTARGLGTGGEPTRGSDAAEESQAEIEATVDGMQFVILCGGLGGGTASGALPVIAEAAKNRGALVIALCSLPFAFEGERRSRQAAEALRDLAKMADAIIFFENDRMSEITQPQASVRETFAAADFVLAECIYSILRIALSGGPIQVSTHDLAAVFEHTPPMCVFGVGESDSSNRANEAVDRALRNPLMNRGKLLADARAVIVHIQGPANLGFVEVQAIMRSIAPHTSPDADLRFGVSLNESSSDSVIVTLLATVEHKIVERTRSAPHPPPLSPAATHRYSRSVDAVPAIPVSQADDSTSIEAGHASSPATGLAELFKADALTTAMPSTKKLKPRQETLRLEAPSRGRFDKSEPTIVGGEDLDVPTFLRMRVKLK